MEGMNKFGIGFWSGAEVYSVVNLIMNFKQVAQAHVFYYDCIITGVAILGLVLNIVLLKIAKRASEIK